MVHALFVNLPVADVARSQAFFAGLGFGFEPRFTNAQAACLVVNAQVQVMLLERAFFQGFTHLPISDARSQTEVLLALSCGSRREVDALVQAAVDGGATTPNPARDMGFMYQHGFQDLDGHVWEVFFMDESAMPTEGPAGG